MVINNFMRVLIFKPDDQESAYLEENKISWSEYCHENLARSMNNQKYVNAEKYQMPMIMVLVGLLILLIAISNIPNPYVLVACFCMSLFSISFGIFSFIGVLKNAR